MNCVSKLFYFIEGKHGIFWALLIARSSCFCNYFMKKNIIGKEEEEGYGRTGHPPKKKVEKKRKG